MPVSSGVINKHWSFPHKVTKKKRKKKVFVSLAKMLQRIFRKSIFLQHSRKIIPFSGKKTKKWKKKFSNLIFSDVFILERWKFSTFFLLNDFSISIFVSLVFFILHLFWGKNIRKFSMKSNLIRSFQLWEINF